MTDAMAPGGAGSRERALRMARRLAIESGAAGLAGPELERILEAYRLAMAPRMNVLAGDDPAFLHPARTALILLADVGPPSPEGLTASILVESEDAQLRAEGERVLETLGADLAARAAAIPDASDSRLLERLLEGDREMRLLALAERLDQVRHGHLRSPEDLRRMRSQALRVYIPVAARTHPGLERRFRRWWENIGRRMGP